MKSLIYAVLGKLILPAFFLLVVVSAHAQSGDTTATIKYLGTQDEMILFNVSYANADGSRVQLLVKDEQGNLLYQSSFTDKAYNKQYWFPKSDNNRLVFIIRDGREADILKTFEVNVSSRYIHDVAVKKLN